MTNILRAVPKSVKNKEKLLELLTEKDLKLMLNVASKDDLLADQVVMRQIKAAKTKKNAVAKGKEKGLASLTDHLPALQALLKESESAPEWVNKNSVMKGAENYLLINSLWQSIALGPSTPTHTYCSPTIANT